MRSQIAEQLAALESTRSCKILYACESGSRAWGFASPDSDYDLRFIYAHPIDWYMKVKAEPDTIDQIAPNDLDLSGWELRKTLRLFQGCNLALNEWFDSPEIYFERPHFAEAVRSLIPAYFNPRKALHHYLSMGDKTLKENLHGDTIKIKKAFYILRPLLACTWIKQFQTMPPTRFAALRMQEARPELQSAIDELLEKKKVSIEGYPIQLEASILNWIYATIENIQTSANQLEPRSNYNWEPLEEIMTRFVGKEES